MERYFLHLNWLRDYVADPEGTELPDLGAAKSEARDTIRELAAHHIMTARPFTLRSIRICNGNAVLLTEVTAAEALSELLYPTLHGFQGPDSHV